MWGIVFVGPLVVPEYSATLQSAGRYLAFGLITLPLAWLDRARLRQLVWRDWLTATKLTIVGNFIYYYFLASSIQRIGAPIATMIIGVIPVSISITANLLNKDKRLPWNRLMLPLALIFAGLLCVNIAELQDGQKALSIDHYITGVVFAFLAVAAWTWFPLKNAQWLRENSDKAAGSWATAQGIVTLPLAILAYVVVYMQMAGSDFPLPFGPRPWVFIGLMMLIGIVCSWLGAVCWNAASQRLPAVLLGPMLVFEILAGMAYAFLWRGVWPSGLIIVGIVCLLGGVVYALRVIPSAH
jgi:drug/metabolite transporter (DMT)-like permease